jgi:hypothetical protein
VHPRSALHHGALIFAALLCFVVSRTTLPTGFLTHALTIYRHKVC